MHFHQFVRLNVTVSGQFHDFHVYCKINAMLRNIKKVKEPYIIIGSVCVNLKVRIENKNILKVNLRSILQKV